jgi:hypothetical protein
MACTWRRQLLALCATLPVEAAEVHRLARDFLS